MEVKAHLNYLRMSPRKVRLVANLIKDMGTAEAQLELKHLPKRAADPLIKLLKSAIANARHNFQLSEENLYIKSILVNQGPTLKRFMPRAFGRAAPIRKRTSHVSLVLDTRQPVGKKAQGQVTSAPLVRDITREDIKEEFRDDKPKGERQIEREKRQTKPSDFVKRVFRRKVV